MVGHVFSELWRNIARNPVTTVSSLLSLTLLFLLFDIFWVAAGTSEQFYRKLLSELTMEVFLAESADDSAVSRIEKHITTLEGVVGTQLVTKAAAREELSRLVGLDLLAGYDDVNPLPQSILVSFRSDYVASLDLSAIEKEIMSLAGVSHTAYSRSWLQKAESARDVIYTIGLMLGGLILLTVVVSSANNMHLMSRSRAVGFEQMRLLGAGRTFLALPFFIEGFALSALAAAAGWGIIYYWKDKVELEQIEIVFPMPDQVALYCAAAALLGVGSTYLGIRKMLK